jgi:hypothetical protein
MAHVDRTVLGAATSPAKWYLDINTGASYAAPTWTAVNGVSNFVPKHEPTLQDDSDYSSGGYGSQAKTGLSWSGEITVGRKVTLASATVYDPGQEALRAAADLLTAARIVDVRWYEVTPGGPIVEAYRGYAEVSYAQGGGAYNDLETATITLSGRGARETITHPDYAHVAPVLYAVSPATGAAAGGILLHITGRNFFLAGVPDVDAATDVTLGTHNCLYHVEDNNNIWAIMPAESQGNSNITVTNSIGASNTLLFVTTA